MRSSNSTNSNHACKHLLLRLLKSPSKRSPNEKSPPITWTRSSSRKVARGTTNNPPNRRKPRFALRAAFRHSHLPSSSTESGLSSLTESMQRDTAPLPTPRTPSMLMELREIVEDYSVEGDEDAAVEDACRWFVWCLTEMVVEERNLRDLRDIEEFVACWKALRSPVFIDLVCSFFVEVSMDLFSGGEGVALYDEDEEEEEVDDNEEGETDTVLLAKE